MGRACPAGLRPSPRGRLRRTRSGFSATALHTAVRPSAPWLIQLFDRIRAKPVETRAGGMIPTACRPTLGPVRSQESVAYYEVAAQVIPIIFLAIVVEFRVFGGGRNRGDWWVSGRALEPDQRVPWTTSLFVVAFGVAFVAAEAVALGAVKDGHASGLAEKIVDFVLLVGFVLVVFVPIQPYFEDLVDRWPPARRFKLWLWRKRGHIPPEKSDEERDD